MNVSFSSDLLSSTISTQESQPRPATPADVGNGGPPDHATAIESPGSSLSDEAQAELLAKVNEMGSSGASFDDIKTFVDSELTSNGVDISSEGQRSGQFVDITA